MTVFELIGRPGAGKTTLARLVSDRKLLPVLDRPVVEFPYRGVLGRFISFVRAPRFSGWLYVLVLSRRGVRLDHIRRAFAVQRRYLGFYGSPPQESSLIDEGVVHSLFSALVGTRASWLSSRALRRILRILVDNRAIFLFLDTDVDKCIGRIQHRSTGGRFSSRGDNQLISLIGKDPYAEMIDAIQETAPGSIRTIHSPDDAVVFLCQELDLSTDAASQVDLAAGQLWRK